MISRNRSVSLPTLLAEAAVLLASGLYARALDPRDFGVEISAQVQSVPAQIRLRWSPSPVATGFTLSRKLLTEDAWRPLASLPGATSGFVDTSVVLGGAYEYEVIESNSDGIVAYGYIYSGIEVPFAGGRGRVVLIVESSVAAALASEVDRLRSDLVGDGWTVLRHEVPSTASPSEVKSLIAGDYYADPANTKALFLFGHVPVPYSGDIAPDLHSNHRGAWPADVFYGNMDGAWTDDSVWSTEAEDPRNHNTPGDGKFDQSQIPGPVALQVGRVDLTDLPAFSPRSEVDLLRQYLNKDHAFRHKQFDVGRRSLIRDNFGEIEGDAPATDAWRAFVSFFGGDNIRAVGSGEFFPTLHSGSFLWAYGGGGGEYYQADGVGSTTDFANQSPQCVFYMLDGSYFGDWDSTDNFLRAALATSGYGLAAAWSGLPHWYLHHMAMGETIGLSTLKVQNNRGLYKNQINLAPDQVHISLMGDPTLRMHIVAPPSNLRAADPGDGTASLTWSPSPDAVQGYYVYRSDTPGGSFARLTRSFLTASSYRDTAPPGGSKTYMVRAVKLETSASGTYYNPSQGVFSNTSAGGGGGPLPVVTIDAANSLAKEAGPVEGAFAVSRSDPLGNPIQVNFSIGGTGINGVDYEPIATSVVLAASAASAWVTIRPITDPLVEGDETVTLTLLPGSGYVVGAPATATVTIEDQALTAVQKIASILRQPDGSVAVQVTGNPQQSYQVQGSSNLLSWSVLGTGVVGSDMRATYLDPQAPTNAFRFYRVEWP